MENITSNIVLGIEEIKQLLPHRHPFLLIDRVENIIPGESCTAYKNVSYDAWYFQGHFPNYPIMPGVLIIEAMAQAAGVLALYSIDRTDKTDSVLFASINNAKFRKQVVPGNTLGIAVDVVQKRSKIWKFAAKAYVIESLSSVAMKSNMNDGLVNKERQYAISEHLADEAEFTAVIP